MNSVNYVVFDLGGVLVDWDPRYLYHKIFDTEDEVEDFLRDICSPDWILQSDAGRNLEDCIADLVAKFPDDAQAIRDYRERWHEMLAGPIEGTVEILQQLKSRDIPLYVLSNWSRDTWPNAVETFAFLNLFDGLVISGYEGVAKPNAKIYQRLTDHGVRLERAVLIDDRSDNIAAAETLGMTGIHYVGCEDLAKRLQDLNLL